MPPFALEYPGPRDLVYLAAGSPGGPTFVEEAAPEECRLCALSPHCTSTRTWCARLCCAPRPVCLQVLFLGGAAALGGVAYDPFFSLGLPMGAFSLSLALRELPGFPNRRPLPNLHWSFIPAGPEPHHGRHSGHNQAPAQGFA